MAFIGFHKSLGHGFSVGMGTRVGGKKSNLGGKFGKWLGYLIVGVIVLTFGAYALAIYLMFIVARFIWRYLKPKWEAWEFSRKSKSFRS